MAPNSAQHLLAGIDSAVRQALLSSFKSSQTKEEVAICCLSSKHLIWPTQDAGLF